MSGWNVPKSYRVRFSRELAILVEYNNTFLFSVQHRPGETLPLVIAGISRSLLRELESFCLAAAAGRTKMEVLLCQLHKRAFTVYMLFMNHECLFFFTKWNFSPFTEELCALPPLSRCTYHALKLLPPRVISTSVLANFLAGPQQGNFLWAWSGFLWVQLMEDELSEHTTYFL